MRERLRELRTSAQRSGQAPQATSNSQPVSPRLFPAKPTRAERAEIELLQYTFTFPDRFTAADLVQPADFTNSNLRELWELCRQTQQLGAAPTFERIVAAIENPALKALAVEIDEQARAVAPAPELLEHLLVYFRRCRSADVERAAALPGPHAGALGGAPIADFDRERLRLATEWNRNRSSKTRTT